MINAEIGNVPPEPGTKSMISSFDNTTQNTVKRDQNSGLTSATNLDENISGYEKQRLEIYSRKTPSQNEQGAFNLTFHSNTNTNLLTNKVVQNSIYSPDSP